MLVIHLNVSEQRKVIVRLSIDRDALSDSRQGSVAGGVFNAAAFLIIGKQLDAVVFEERRLGRQRSRLLVFFSEFSRLDLAGFDVRLIEWIDADDRSGHSGGEFPTKEFLPEVVDVGNGNRDYRMTRRLKFCNRRVLTSIGCRFEIADKRTRDRRRKLSGVPSVSRSTGINPLPFLPVDSATNCSSQAPRS